MMEETITLPKHLKIGGHTYHIIEEDSPFLSDDGGQGLSGQCDLNGGVIRVVTKQMPTKVLETLMHEAIHAISDNRAAGMSEHQVDQIAAGLVALFADNPEVMKLIMRGMVKVDYKESE